MGRLDGKVAIITGGARGMGESHARRFIEEGARVVLADRLVASGEALAEELGERAIFAETDVTDPEDWTRLVETATVAFGPPDVLVNNAGILINHHLTDATLDQFERTVGANQVGVFLGMQALARSMRESGGGAIVNIGSTAGLVGAPWCFAYVASKWAVRGMTKAAAMELATQGIRVNAVHPGDVETPMTAEQRAKGQITTEGIPMDRFGLADEISSAVVFLASDESSYVTGTDLVVDGGFTAI